MRAPGIIVPNPSTFITMGSLQKLGLKVGDLAYACFKATDVIIAAD